MTQPDKPAARGARPQLFGTPAASRPRASRQPDFGPSILATIDGGAPRSSGGRDGVSVRTVLLMSLAALGLVAVYFGVKFMVAPGGTSDHTPPVLQVAKVAEVKPVAAPEPTAPASGAAAIENVATPPSVLASAAASAPVVADAASPIQRILETPPAPAATKSTERVAYRAPSERAAPSKPAAAPKATNDRDTDLLAAMLPHLKRRDLGQTSPAHEKRCGQLAGNAAEECRTRFCNGREGSDAACPVSPVR